MNMNTSQCCLDGPDLVPLDVRSLMHYLFSTRVSSSSESTSGLYKYGNICSNEEHALSAMTAEPNLKNHNHENSAESGVPTN